MAKARFIHCVFFLAGCIGGTASDTLDAPEAPAAGGPDDCSNETQAGEAAVIALGLGADSGIFLQPLWQADELQYLVINDRDEAVDILANADLAGCNGELVSERLAGPWTLEARSHRVLSGSEVTALFGQYSSWFANGSPLGVDHLGERPPLAAEAGMVISNHGMNGGGGDSFAQIETDFVVAPGPTFTITIVLPPGDLTLAARPFEVGLRTVDVLAVR